MNIREVAHKLYAAAYSHHGTRWAWLYRLPFLGAFLSGFSLPRASRSAFDYFLFWAFFGIAKSSAIEQGYPWWYIPLMALLGFLVLLWSLGLSLLIIGFIGFQIARHFTKEQVEMPPAFQPSVINVLSIVPDVLFVTWGVLFLLGHSYRGFNRALLLTGAVYFVAGCLIGISRGFGNWRRTRCRQRKWYVNDIAKP